MVTFTSWCFNWNLYNFFCCSYLVCICVTRVWIHVCACWHTAFRLARGRASAQHVDFLWIQQIFCHFAARVARGLSGTHIWNRIISNHTVWLNQLYSPHTLLKLTHYQPLTATTSVQFPSLFCHIAQDCRIGRNWFATVYVWLQFSMTCELSMCGSDIFCAC